VNSVSINSLEARLLVGEGASGNARLPFPLATFAFATGEVRSTSTLAVPGAKTHRWCRWGPTHYLAPGWLETRGLAQSALNPIFKAGESFGQTP
jgi:hypothetical protein